ncbi:MAG: RagB/SusD family nutrient uptake outer membrane protein [Marinilabiliaceae bacterium]|nr:RagB/SusD family nutrient uptake outer membrane protein [Marinilabiliaceae bacterium]
MKYKYSSLIAMSCAALLGFSSCEDYLDKEPGTDVDETTAFETFDNFQGFVEELYLYVPHKAAANYCSTFNWGEDEIMNTGGGNNHVTYQFDGGNFKNWYQNNQSWLKSASSTYRDNNEKGKNLTQAWYAIRKANLGLEHLKDFPGTKEERNVLEGQMLFFRAWYHEEMIQFFGGLPYVESVLEGPEDLPRLSYRETAEKCAQDFERAAELLPLDWDKCAPGKATKGYNGLRVTKIAALGYLGRVLLWAASPLMENGAQLGGLKSGKTYEYNDEYAKRAAEAFGKALALVEKGETPYSFVEFNFEKVYDHKKAEGVKYCYSDLFYNVDKNWEQPGATEAIFRGPAFGNNGGAVWNHSYTWGPKFNNMVMHDKIIHMPTANYVNYAYGMANGMPIIDAEGNLVPDSGFDPTHPFDNRDPRFYHDIVFDRFKYMLGRDDESRIPYQYCQLYTGGNMRQDTELGSRTGYFTQKLVPHQCNQNDKYYDYGRCPQAYISYMRLADLYLMYAEACCAVDGNNYKSSSFGKSAEEALNIVRDRVGAGRVNSAYVGNKNRLMDEIRRERACELAFEGFRFNDLQRWLLLSEYPYTIKTSQEFYRDDSSFKQENDVAEVGPVYAEDEADDPRIAKVSNFHEELILERKYTARHYWLPLREEDVNTFKDFAQNPGW